LALNGVSFEASAPRIAAFREGLNERGFVEGQNVSVIYRSAEGQDERLSGLASDLVSRRVAVIVAIGGEAAVLAAKKATATIPIVFATGGDALADGLVNSLNRPSSNVTGVTFLSTTLGLKRLGLLRDVLPSATLIGLLANSNDWGNRGAFDDSMADVSTGAKVSVASSSYSMPAQISGSRTRSKQWSSGGLRPFWSMPTPF
jgi:ABC-type uncharacterized transport system substrate-binding protein